MTLTCLILVSAFLSACSNTFEGAGRDVENAGEWVQDTF
jgi:predicted small secreted protein